MVVQEIGFLIYLHNIMLEPTQNEKHINLIKLINENDIDGIKNLINSGIDLNDVSFDSPIHIATEKGNPNIVEILIIAGADVEAINDFGQRPIHILSENGNIDLLNLLLNYAYIDSREGHGIGSKGNTALHYAVQHNSQNMTQLLIGAGATINIKNNFRETPLHNAVLNNSLENVKLLLRYASDELIYEENINNQTAIDLAKDVNIKIFNLLNRYVKSLSLSALRSKYSMNDDVVGVVNKFMGGGTKRSQIVRKRIENLMNYQPINKENKNLRKISGGSYKDIDNIETGATEPYDSDEATELYDSDEATELYDSDEATEPYDSDDDETIVIENDYIFNENDFYKSSNHSDKEKLIYSVNTGNLDMMIHFIGIIGENSNKDIFDVHTYALLRKSAHERGYIEMVKYLDDAYNYILRKNRYSKKPKYSKKPRYSKKRTYSKHSPKHSLQY
tara:strand:- start:646 stop:1989 length:1344 start_codon:yes stop_codon:yes gene_type:complete